jgi:hypothetical protein
MMVETDIELVVGGEEWTVTVLADVRVASGQAYVGDVLALIGDEWGPVPVRGLVSDDDYRAAEDALSRAALEAA